MFQSLNNFQSESIPSCFARGCEVNETIGSSTSFAETLDPIRNHSEDCVGNQRRRGRCANLIRDNAQFFPLLRQSRNSSQKILAVRRIDPASSHNQRTTAR